MQSWTRSTQETLCKTFATSIFAFVSNYFLLDKFWTLPPSLGASLEMVAWFGGGSFLISLSIRRWFNARG
jgi:hypothetical protein